MCACVHVVWERRTEKAYKGRQGGWKAGRQEDSVRGSELKMRSKGMEEMSKDMEKWKEQSSGEEMTWLRYQNTNEIRYVIYVHSCSHIASVFFWISEVCRNALVLGVGYFVCVCVQRRSVQLYYTVVRLSLRVNWRERSEQRERVREKNQQTNTYTHTHTHTHTDIWRKKCCIWHIIASRSLLAAKSLQPNRIKTYFPLQKTVEHLDGSNLALCSLQMFRLKFFLFTNIFRMFEHQFEWLFLFFFPHQSFHSSISLFVSSQF